MNNKTAGGNKKLMFATLLTLAMGAGAFDVASAESSIEQAVRNNSGSPKPSATNNIHIDRDVLPVRTSSLVVNNGSSLSISDAIKDVSFAPQGALVGGSENTVGSVNPTYENVIAKSESDEIIQKNNTELLRPDGLALTDTDESLSSGDLSPKNHLTVQKEVDSSLALRMTNNNKNLNNLANKSDKTRIGGITLTAGADTLTPAQIGTAITDSAVPMESGALRKSMLDATVWSTATTFSLTQEEKEELVSIKDLVNAYASVPLDVVSVANNGVIGINSSEVSDNGEISFNVYGENIITMNENNEVAIQELPEFDNGFVWDLRNEDDDEPAEVDHLRARVDSVLGTKNNTLMAKIKGVPTGFAAIDRQVVESGQTVDLIEGTFSGHTDAEVVGAFINNAGTIKSVIADVLNNTQTNTTNVYSTLIYNYGSSAVIDSIKGRFISNTLTGYNGGSGYSGALIRNLSGGHIGTIEGDFIGNSTIGRNTAAGPSGIIYTDYTIDKVKGNFINNQVHSNATNSSASCAKGLFSGLGSITDLSGNFIGNSVVHAGNASATGGVFDLNVNYLNGKFINNYAQTESGYARGGVSSGNIGNIGSSENIAQFIGNYAKSNSGPVSGGAIYNSRQWYFNIAANFIGNYAQSTSDLAQGGAIWNSATTTSNISGDFVNNHATSTSGSTAFGGAIYNQGTIGGDIIGTFINNYVTAGTNKTARGGAIWNSGTISGAIKADFLNNSATGASWSQGGAIWNQTGSISGIEGNFINNKVSSALDAKASGIYNYSNGNIGYIKGNFINNSTTATGTSTSYIRNGVIVNDHAIIGAIEANFIGNTITNNVSGIAAGGALMQTSGSTITSIGKKSDRSLFYNNKVTSVDYDAAGSAIMNVGTITNIYADFINNVSSTNGGGDAVGALYNQGTISHLEGAFIGNTVSTTTGLDYYSGGGGLMNEGGTVSIFDSAFLRNSVSVPNAGGSAIANYGGTTNITDSVFYNNTNSNTRGALSSSGGTTSLIAKSADVLFYGNKGDTIYADYNGNATTLNLNAAVGNQIRFGGTVTGTGATSIININNGADSAPTGGDYVFGSSLSNSKVNLYNSAEVRFVPTRQLDGSLTYGVLNAASFTNDANGGYLNLANSYTNGWQKFGALTLNSDLKVALDMYLTVSQDGLDATSVSANGHKILIDYINILDDTDDITPGSTYTRGAFTSNLYSVLGLASTLKINSAYEWDGYSASYDSSTGSVILAKVDTGKENLAGFLHNDDGTSAYAGKRGSNITINDDTMIYKLTRDEQVLTSLDTMAGTSKTIEGNGYTIIGNQNAGINLTEGQVLIINNANVEGFYREDGDGGSVINAANGELYINNSTFVNNSVGSTDVSKTVQGSVFSGRNLTIVDSDFYNNISNSGSYGGQGGVISGGANIYARTKNSIFDGNFSNGVGAVAQVHNDTNIKGENGNKVIFSNNYSSYNVGAFFYRRGVHTIDNAEFLYNGTSGTVGAIQVGYADYITQLEISNTLFKGNYATQSAAIYNNSNSTLSITNSIFDSNIASLNSGGAIYSKGIISEIFGTEFINNQAAQYGGAIYNDTNATITKISDTTFMQNMANQGGAIYNAGTIGSMENVKMVDTSLADSTGGFIYNTGTIGTIDAEVKNNIHNASSAYSALIVNTGGTISSITGEYDDNIVNALNNGVSDDGIILYNTGNIGTIDAHFNNNKMYNTSNNTDAEGLLFNNGEINNIYGTFDSNSATGSSGNIVGGVITNLKNIGNIDAIFKKNFVNATDSNSSSGGVFYTSSGSIINSISGIFDSNYAQSISDTANGGVITNSGTISNIKDAMFNGNYVSSVDYLANGGVIYNASTITSINNVVFENNYAESINGASNGGAIYNLATIGEIKDSIFKNNYISRGRYGGAIQNYGDSARINSITNVLFDSNSVKKISVSGTYGGAISNETHAYIGSITGLFKNNTVGINSGDTQGGAIWNHVESIINNIDADFINNGTLGASSIGGAITNHTNSTINHISGLFKGNYVSDAANHGGGAIGNYKSTINELSGIFVDNYVNNGEGGAIWNENGTIGIVANGSDTIFKNNKIINSSTTTYNDLYNTKTVHLNAKSGNYISFGGSVTGSGTININNGYNSSQTGGDYVFYTTVSGQTMNLYDGAKVKSGIYLQDDGEIARGALNLTALTNDANGGYLSFINGYSHTQRLGNVTLGSDLKLALDYNRSSGYGDDLTAETVTANGHKMLIDTINVFNAGSSTSGQTYSYTVTSTNALKSVIGLVTNPNINSLYKWNDYTASYNASTGVVTLTYRGNGTYNLNGFLSQDASGTSYTLARDEMIMDSIGAMAGSNNTKTVNAGDYRIAGRNNAGVNVATGQTLNINGGVWDGFYKSVSYGGVFQNTYGTLNINNATFTNNYGQSHGGILFNDGNSTTTINNSTFINNRSGSGYGGALFNRENCGTTYHGTLTVNNSTFTGNTIAGAGGAIGSSSGNKTTITDSSFYYNSATGTSSGYNGGGAIAGAYSYSPIEIVAATKDVVFKGNSATTVGGAIAMGMISAGGTLNINATGGDVTFNNNTAGTSGGAIYNTGTMTLNVTGGDVIFSNNNAGSNGGAIYNSGTINITASNDHKMLFQNNSTTNTYGGAIYTSGAINNIYADFYNNIVNNPTSTAMGGAIYSAGGAIGNIVGKFVNNSAETSSKYALGGAIKTNAELTNIQADFTGNYVLSTSEQANKNYAMGGAIYYPSGSAGTINGNFKDNYAKSVYGYAQGGAIQAGPTTTISGSFTDNYALSEGSYAYGGAISNPSNIETISADFTGNYAKAINDVAQGGAIYNTGTITTIGSATDHAEFSKNYVQSESGTVYGGGIYNTGTITNIYGDFTNNNSSVLNNSNTANSAGGGAISNEDGAHISSIVGNFTSNSAVNNWISTASVAYQGLGGAIRSKGQIDSIDGIFTGNYAIGTTAYGGAIHKPNGGVITSISGTFINNYAQSTDGRAYGGAINLTNTSTDSINADFTGNRTISVGSGNTYGGAIANLNANGVVTTIGSASDYAQFSGNYAKSESGAAFGGGIYNAGTITNLYADFNDNYAQSEIGEANGGAIFNSGTITTIGSANDYAQFTGNHAQSEIGEANGGAIFNSGTITNLYADFTNNYVTTVTGNIQGGAIRNNMPGATIDTIGTATNHAIFTGNYVSSTDGTICGGAMHNGQILTTLYGDFTDNYAVSENSSALGGALSHSGYPTSIYGLFSNNYAQSGSNNASGGAMYLQNQITTIGSANDYAQFSGNYVRSETGTAYGGAIRNLATITDIYADFTNNYAQSQGIVQGGAILNSNLITTLMGDFSNNYAISQRGSATGGAIHNVSTITTLTGDFIGNYAKSETGTALGGAIYNIGTINNVTGIFKDNIAQSTSSSVGKAFGGAIHNLGNIKITNSKFENNSVISRHVSSSYEEGGAIYNEGKMIIKNTDFINNTTTYVAGAIENNSGTINIDNALFIGNKTLYGGGGVGAYHQNNGIGVIKNAMFINNISKSHGAGIQIWGGANLTVIDTDIYGGINGAIKPSALDITGSSDTANVVADSKNVIFINNLDRNNTYSDVNVGTSASILNLNAISNKSINFGGEVINAGTININKSGLSYTNLNDDFTTSSINITQTVDYSVI